MESRLGSNIDSQIWEKRDQDQRLRLKTALNRDGNLAGRVSRVSIKDEILFLVS